MMDEGYQQISDAPTTNVVNDIVVTNQAPVSNQQQQPIQPQSQPIQAQPNYYNSNYQNNGPAVYPNDNGQGISNFHEILSEPSVPLPLYSQEFDDEELIKSWKHKSKQNNTRFVVPRECTNHYVVELTNHRVIVMKHTEKGKKGNNFEMEMNSLMVQDVIGVKVENKNVTRCKKYPFRGFALILPAMIIFSLICFEIATTVSIGIGFPFMIMAGLMQIFAIVCLATIRPIKPSIPSIVTMVLSLPAHVVSFAMAITARSIVKYGFYGSYYQYYGTWSVVAYIFPQLVALIFVGISLALWPAITEKNSSVTINFRNGQSLSAELDLPDIHELRKSIFAILSKKN